MPERHAHIALASLTSSVLLLMACAELAPYGNARDPDGAHVADLSVARDLGFVDRDAAPRSIVNPGAGCVFVVPTHQDDLHKLTQTSSSPDPACALVTVARSGYYELEGPELADSCATQLAETGYFLITNSCNAEGYPLGSQGEEPSLFLVHDTDNRLCTSDGDCGSEERCVSRDGQMCCAPTGSVKYGTFLLLAGEENEVCLYHGCRLADLSELPECGTSNSLDPRPDKDTKPELFIVGCLMEETPTTCLSTTDGS